VTASHAPCSMIDLLQSVCIAASLQIHPLSVCSKNVAEVYDGSVTHKCDRNLHENKSCYRYIFKLRIKCNSSVMCGNHIDSRGEGEVFIFLLEHEHAASRNSLIDFFLKAFFYLNLCTSSAWPPIQNPSAYCGHPSAEALCKIMWCSFLIACHLYLLLMAWSVNFVV
jgi:hypothetical protein